LKVQKRGHSGTLRAMSESVPANKTRSPGEQPGRGLQAPATPVVVPVAENGAEQQEAREIGGPQGPEPTRFGDWERKGRCIDF
jgi:hypothetical protein